MTANTSQSTGETSQREKALREFINGGGISEESFLAGWDAAEKAMRDAIWNDALEEAINAIYDAPDDEMRGMSRARAADILRELSRNGGNASG